MDQRILYALPFILLFVALRLWRGSRARKLRVEAMWIRPLIILLILGATIYADPPPLAPVSAAIVTLVVLGVAAVAGFVFGWQRGRMVRISIDVETHALTSQQSPWALLILIAIIAIRFGIRYALQGEHEYGGVPVALIADAVTVLYGGNIVGMQLEQWLRARKLVAETVAAKAAGKAMPAEVTQAHAGDPTEAGHG
jgi:hypothetical protein